MRLQGKILNLLGFVIIDLRRTNVLSATPSLWIQEGILVCEIVKPALRDYLKNWQDLITEDANRQFPAGHKFFYQQFSVVFRRFHQGGIELTLLLHDNNAYGRALPRRLHHDWQRNRRVLTRLHHFPIRSRYIVFAKFLFREDFVESDAALFYPIPGVSDTAIFENFLQLAILPESSVNRKKREVDIGGKFEIFIPHIHIDYFDT